MSKKPPTETAKPKSGAVCEMAVVMVPLESLKFPSYNPRIISDHDIEELARCHKTFGSVQPAVVNRHHGREGIIVGGSQRVRAAKKLGWKEYPCVYVDLDEKRERELNIRLNRNTGTFDYDVLAREFKASELLEYGFEVEDFLGTALAADAAKEEMDKAQREDEEELIDRESESEASMLSFYCAMEPRARIDLGASACGNNCLYCFTRCTPAGHRRKAGSVTLTKRDVLRKTLKLAKEKCFPLITGLCNDPAAPEFRNNLLFLLTEATRLQTHVRIQTKRPGIVLEAMKEVKADPALVGIKTSFSFCTEDKAGIVEPNAPPVMERAAQLEQAARAGVDTIIRFQPFFIDYYDGMDKVLGVCKHCTRVVVEAVRISATGKDYFTGVGPALTKDGGSIENYLKRIRRESHPMYGVLHWFDVEPAIMRDALVTLKKIVNDADKAFGICSSEFGMDNLDLNDGDYCCQTKREVGYDACSIVSLYHQNKLNSLRVPLLAEAARRTDSVYFHRMVGRIAYVNDVTAHAVRLRPELAAEKEVKNERNR